MQSTARAENDDDSPVELSDCVVEDAHRWPLIPDDTYRVRYTRHECGRVASFNQQAKLFFRARIIDPGPYNGIELFRSYRVTLIVGGKSTRFKVRRNSDLMKMVCKVLMLRNCRSNLVPILQVDGAHRSTRTVKKDDKQLRAASGPLVQCYR